MKPFLITLLALVAAVLGSTNAHATRHLWYETSPDHGQTFAYGTQVRQYWRAEGSNQHLVLHTTFDNEPWAQGSNRQYDNFAFNFPRITLGSDGQTFFLHTKSGMNLPVARIDNGFLWSKEIKLLPTAYLAINKVHGYLTVTLVICDEPMEPNPNVKIGFQH